MADGTQAVRQMQLPPLEWVPRALRNRGDKAELDCLQAAWPEVVARCRLVQPLLSGLLKDSWPVSLTHTTLVIGFDPAFRGELEEVRRNERGTLHNLFHRLLDRPVNLDYTVLDQPVVWSHHAPEPEPETAGADPEPFDPETAGYSSRAWKKDEAVQRLLDHFGGDIIDIQL